MKILMFGRGVISAQYAYVLEKAGHTVEFYVRPGKKAAAIPLDIYDRGKHIQTTWRVTMREDLPPDHDYDLIVVSVQHYQFKNVAAFLSGKAGNATILIFNNFWNDPMTEAAALPKDQLAWGFPMAAGGVDQRGVLKGALFGRVHFGTFGTAPTAREIAVRQLFKSSGFKILEHKDFKTWLSIHFLVNAGLLSQALRAGSLGLLLSSKEHGQQVVLNVRELFPVLQQRGIKVQGEAALFKLPPSLVSLLMRTVMKLNPAFRHSLLNHSNPEEVKSFCRDVLAEAKSKGIAVPRLESVASYL
ncbi:ketopantoate reductase family protein [Chitinophaga pinensis]|nr:2-dehydropantoate 2-reductase N-terminal domain-containing protein [Chitinophaga pinensis]